MDESAILKMLSIRAVKEFEEMKAKCTEYHDKFIYNQKRVQKLEFQFKQLKKASLLAVSEYENLHKSYTAEIASRQDLEAQLSKIDSENKHLRKANDYAPNTMIMREQSDGSAGKGELEGLRGLVVGMKDELRRAKEEIVTLKSDLNSEQVSHETTQRKYRVAQEHVKQLNSVSVMALEEYQQLKKQHEIELACRTKAEEYASEMVREKAITDRKSKWFAEHSDNDERLQAALDNVDKITREADEEQNALKKKIKELEDELNSSKEEQTVKDAEKRMQIALDQVDLLQTQLEYSEKRGQDLEIENKSMRTRLDAALAGIFIPAPPPPPPTPPPPPLPGQAIRGFISKLGGKKKKLAGQPPPDDPRADAMAEMIARIKGGKVKLKSTRSEATNRHDSAMGELASMLSNLRQGRAPSQDSLDVPDKEEAKQPEFQKLKLKKVVRKEPSVADSVNTKPESGELKKILDRKRSAAASAHHDTKVPPAVAPKTEKVNSLRQESITSDTAQVPHSSDQTANNSFTASPPSQTIASSVNAQPLVQKDKAGSFSESNASAISPETYSQSPPIDVPPKKEQRTSSSSSASVSPSKSSSPPKQLDTPSASSEDTDGVPSRPPRRRSSAKTIPNTADQKEINIELDDKEKSPENVEQVPDIESNDVKPDSSSPKVESATDGVSEQQPTDTAEPVTDKAPSERDSIIDSEYAAAMDEIDQLMNDLTS